jgi:hypothetical protein
MAAEKSTLFGAYCITEVFLHSITSAATLTISVTLKMDTVCFSEMSEHAMTKWCRSPEGDHHFHNVHVNLKIII